MVKEDIKLVVEKKAKVVLNILLVDLLLLDVRKKVKVKLGEKQNDKVTKHTYRKLWRTR
jgi:hypothetical protein